MGIGFRVELHANVCNNTNRSSWRINWEHTRLNGWCPGCVKMGLSVLENGLLNTKARYNADGLGRASFNEILDSKDRFSERGVLF